MVHNGNGDKSKKDEYATTAGTKRKRVCFEGANDQGSDTPGKAIKTAEANSPVAQHDVDRITSKMIDQVMKMAKNKDLAGLHQGYQMLKCVEQRCSPPATSGLGLYLNVPPGEDGDPHGCVVKLRELLDLFPMLEDIHMDNHMLAWMIRGLQLTGQSIDMELLPAYMMSFSQLFYAQFKNKAKDLASLRVSEVTDLICRARDNAEKMVEMESSSDGTLKCPSHPYINDVDRIWKEYEWVPEDPANDEEAESDEV